MQSNGPLRILRWDTMDATARRGMMTRGLADIFDPALREGIAALVADVRDHGDAAVARALARFDGCAVDPARLAVTEHELDAAERAVGEEVKAAVRQGIANIRAFNERLVERRVWRTELAPGHVVGERLTPIASAALFVPSGKGSYPSTLMHLATPAVVAGVPELTIIVPPVPGGGGAVDAAVLFTARELGIARVFRANGPAGVAAAAFGTATIPQARKVLGPGSPPVQLAQIECQRYGCHTQMLLGPSESLILADDSADRTLLAADLLNEAEHGADSSVVLVTPSATLVADVQEELARQMERLPEPRLSYAKAALGRNGGAVLVDDLDTAVEVANLYAAEHMQLAVRDPEALLQRVEHAGEVLLGQGTPISVANYVLGIPAALPTGGFARVTGGVTAETFMKRTSFAAISESALAALAPATAALAEHEGFPAHAASVRVRAAQPATAFGVEEEFNA